MTEHHDDVTISHQRYIELTEAERRLTDERDAAVGFKDALIADLRRLFKGLQFDENDPESIVSALYAAWIDLESAQEALKKVDAALWGEDS